MTTKIKWVKNPFHTAGRSRCEMIVTHYFCVFSVIYCKALQARDVRDALILLILQSKALCPSSHLPVGIREENDKKLVRPQVN